MLVSCLIITIKMLRNTYLYLLICILYPQWLEAAPRCAHWVAKVTALQGRVEFQSFDDSAWHLINRNDTLCPGDKIRTLNRSRATLELSNDSLVTLNQKTNLVFYSKIKETYRWLLNLINGSTFFRSRHPHHLQIRTPFVNAIHEGTEFLVTVNEQQTEISVFDGQVTAINEVGQVLLKKGFAAIAEKNQPPRKHALTIKPADAVQWTLHYPPVIDYPASNLVPRSAKLQKAITFAQQNNFYAALNSLDNVPIQQQGEIYHVYKASLLLNVGAINEALQNINQALALNKKNSDAIALQAIIAVTKNRQNQALDLAEQAVALNPRSSPAKIALSYAYQSLFNIDQALEMTQKATQLTPDNGLAWSRLAELQLATGNRSAALTSATTAKFLNPGFAGTYTVSGFAHLAQFNIDTAETDFRRAIDFDSSDPLPRLGLGLAKIRKGHIEAGTRDLETAASLDPNNALVRSYLGKAYYELRNESYASSELALAKDLDPNDPTPWFYDAILKQTTNRPIEALQAMQKSIELNDNRAVYRSKLLLDQDTAARTANMARIYNDLDFERLALKQSWSSLGYDASNYSAHRFLADSYKGRPRLHIARASEILQAQLLQPINITPVQPQLTSENISVLNGTGPSSLSTNEYDPLFTSNGVHLLLNGAIGGNDTRTNSAVLSGVYDQFSVSLGQFNYKTDGFRVNDDYEQNIYNIFAQAALTTALNFQVEFKREDVTAGDVPLRFNRFHQENLRQTIDQDTARFGLHYKIDPEQDIILSTFLTRFKENESNNPAKKTVNVLSGVAGTLETTTTTSTTTTFEESGYQLEGQYLFHPQSFHVIAGFGYLNLAGNVSSTIQRDKFQHFKSLLFFIPDKTTFETTLSKTTRHAETNYFNGYIYSSVEIVKGLSSLLGLSFDAYNDGLTDRNQFNPKVGLTWNPTKELTFRGAIFRTLKRPLAASQTIEPTQVAGFNQFFDGNDGTTAWNYGFGIDYQPFKNLFVGGEVTWRDTTQPVLTTINMATPQDRDEFAHLAYLYWTPFDWAAFSSEYRFEEFRRDYTVNSIDPTKPRSVASHQVPLSFNFYHSSGLFAKFTGTFIKQVVEHVNSKSGLDKESDRFWLFDTALGFRLPKRIGSISLEVRNLFNNKNFRYNSVFDASGPQLSPFIPEREFFFKLNIAY